MLRMAQGVFAGRYLLTANCFLWELTSTKLVVSLMKPETPPAQTSWLPLGVLLLILLFTPLGSLWLLFLVGVIALAWLKFLPLERAFLWGAVVFAGGLFSAGGWNGSSVSPVFNPREVEDSQAFDTSGLRRLEVRGFNGFIRLTVAKESKLQVERKGGASLNLERREDVLILTAKKPFFAWNSGINLTLNVPANLELSLKTSNGVIDAVGAVKNLEASTSNASINVKDTGNTDLKLETSNDVIVLERVSGRVNARTSNGSIRVTNANDVELKLETSNASLMLERVNFTNNSKSSLFTSNGNVQLIGLNAPSGFLIRGSTSNSKIDVNLPGFDLKLEDQKFEARRSNGFGMAELEIKTSNDRVTVRP
jgi:hypothetical protein